MKISTAVSSPSPTSPLKVPSSDGVVAPSISLWKESQPPMVVSPRAEKQEKKERRMEKKSRQHRRKMRELEQMEMFDVPIALTDHLPKHGKISNLPTNKDDQNVQLPLLMEIKFPEPPKFMLPPMKKEKNDSASRKSTSNKMKKKKSRSNQVTKSRTKKRKSSSSKKTKNSSKKKRKSRQSQLHAKNLENTSKKNSTKKSPGKWVPSSSVPFEKCTSPNLEEHKKVDSDKSLRSLEEEPKRSGERVNTPPRVQDDKPSNHKGQ